MTENAEGNEQRIINLSELISPAGLKLLSASGIGLVHEIGLDIVRGVVLDVMSGKNLRDATESLTRSRIVGLNLATVELFLRGSANYEDFLDRLPHIATDMLKQKRVSKQERWIAQWVLGLTDKGMQNILRDTPQLLTQYRDRYIKTCHDVIDNLVRTRGDLGGELHIDSGLKAEISWLMMAYLLNTVGAQTLTIRGSEKSAYGKLFEKLILGSLLEILGFRYVQPPPEKFERVFWLSSREEKRESDATLLYEPGKGARLDIGFIGRGNPEITLDKVSRFEREISLGRSKYYMATIILVDRIGPNSSIEHLAREIDGCIIQMSAGYWPQQVAHELSTKLGYRHRLAKMKQSRIGNFLERELAKINIKKFIPPSGQ